jgi:hypothetical protein
VSAASLVRILSVLYLALAAISALTGLLQRIIARREFAWVQVPGTIIDSRVEQGETISARLQYHYEYEGSLFQGSRICSLLVEVIWPQRAEAWVARYPPGAAVTVYVNPADPRFAVLEPGGDPRFFTTAFATAGAFLFVAYIGFDF